MKWHVVVLGLLCIGVSAGCHAEDLLWTSKPVRIDPKKQNFERLPSLTLGLEGAETISFPRLIEMHDSTSFSAAGTEYRLYGLKAIARDRLCRSETGARWPCGNQAAIFVSNLFRGHTLVCKVERKPEEVLLSGCRTTRMRIPFTIVAQGYAFPMGGDEDLEVAVMSARTLRTGVWKDAACSAATHSC